MGRIFSVRINLDDMAAGLDAYQTTEELADWLRGFRIGSRGIGAKSAWSEAMLSGHSFGLEAYDGAVAFSIKQSAKGKLRHSHGSATAQPNISRGSAISNNPIIQVSSNRVNQPELTSDPFDGMDEDETPIELAKPLPPEPRRPLRLNFKDWSTSHPRLWIARGSEDGCLGDWSKSFDAYMDEGRPTAFDAMYKSILATLAPDKRINYRNALEWLTEHYDIVPERT